MIRLGLRVANPGRNACAWCASSSRPAARQGECGTQPGARRAETMLARTRSIIPHAEFGRQLPGGENCLRPHTPQKTTAKSSRRPGGADAAVHSRVALPQMNIFCLHRFTHVDATPNHIHWRLWEWATSFKRTTCWKPLPAPQSSFSATSRRTGEAFAKISRRPG